ncbi:GLPGLI family protein [Halpernia sp.]|uniref:GLPGLI family protein n=1 Tax=Halpernia sp. TaxID=2782209 RepID=UPI003A94DCF8
MKRQFSIVLLMIAFALNAQTTANRFFYELTFKPKQDSAKLEKVMTVLDISKDKSIYQDYTLPAQDSLIKVAVDEMEKTKTWKDISKSLVLPKFTYKVIKSYPSMKSTYEDRISRNLFGYEEDLKFNWKISSEKEKIGEYNTQKATADFGGRQWTAWFSTDIPFQDGPYKFSGLPGLIVKIEDSGHNYSWLLKGNKKLENYSEQTEAEKINEKYGMSSKVNIVSKERFEKAYNNFKADPLAEARPYMSNAEVMNRKMPGSDVTLGQYLKEQEKIAKDFFNSNDNPIEISSSPKK